MMGPTPFAFTMHQIKKVTPAMGVTMALRVKRCRLIILEISNLGTRLNRQLHLMDREPDSRKR